MKYKKVAILFTSEEASSKALDMLENSGFKRPSNFKISKNAAILVGWNGKQSQLQTITTDGYDTIYGDSDGYKLFMDKGLTMEIIQTFEGSKPSGIEIDVSWLIKKDACEEGFKWFVAKYGRSNVNSSVVIKDLRNEGLEDWAMWVKNRTQSSKNPKTTAPKFILKK